MKPLFPAKTWVSMTYGMKKAAQKQAEKEGISLAELFRNAMETHLKNRSEGALNEK